MVQVLKDLKITYYARSLRFETRVEGLQTITTVEVILEITPPEGAEFAESLKFDVQGHAYDLTIRDLIDKAVGELGRRGAYLNMALGRGLA